MFCINMSESKHYSPEVVYYFIMKLQVVLICAVMISAIFADETNVNENRRNTKRGIGHLGYGGNGFDNGYGFQHRSYPGFSKIYNGYDQYHGSNFDDYDYGYYGGPGDYYGGNRGYYGDEYNGELGYHREAPYYGGLRNHYPHNYNQYRVGHGVGHHLF